MSHTCRVCLTTAHTTSEHVTHTWWQARQNAAQAERFGAPTGFIPEVTDLQMEMNPS